MIGTNQNFSMYSGDSKKIFVSIVDSKGTSINLLGSTVTWVLLKQNGIEVTRKTSPGGVVFTQPEEGKLLVSLEPEDTNGLVGEHIHAMRIKDSSGIVSTVIKGQITIQRLIK